MHWQKLISGFFCINMMIELPLLNYPKAIYQYFLMKWLNFPIFPTLMSDKNRLWQNRIEQLIDGVILRYTSAYHGCAHIIWGDLSKGQGTLCSHEQIKVPQWLNLIRVARQQQSDLSRLRNFFFFMFHAVRNQGHCSCWVFSMDLTSWYSSTSFLWAN